MRRLLSWNSRRMNLAAAAALVVVAVLSPLLAWDCPYYGDARKCTVYLVTPCPTDGMCLDPDHCDLGMNHMVINSWDTFPGCKTYMALPTDTCEKHPYGCFYIIYSDDMCQDYFMFAYPYCFCECIGGDPPPPLN